jgi:hypothetical protein
MRQLPLARLVLAPFVLLGVFLAGCNGGGGGEEKAKIENCADLARAVLDLQTDIAAAQRLTGDDRQKADARTQQRTEELTRIQRRACPDSDELRAEVEKLGAEQSQGGGPRSPSPDS